MEQSMHSRARLEADLRALGVRSGDTVLMHSSYKSLGGVEGGAAGFFEAFLSLLGPEGTLVLPSLSYEYVTREQPVFDVRETPSCVGYLTEFFRTQVPGVVRSLHATHSCCAIGRQAQALTGTHLLDDTPVGPNSPFAKLPEMDGWILMLGCHPDHNTSMHGVEQTAEPPYLLDRTARVRYVLRDAQGVAHEQWALRHNFVLDGWYYEQRYSRILSLLSDSEVRRGRVLSADCVMMRADAVWEKGRRMLLRDPFYFVDRVPTEE